MLRAGLAYLGFVPIHPFDDGNGHIARAIADMALARSENSPQRLYSASARIRQERNRCRRRARDAAGAALQCACSFLRADAGIVTPGISCFCTQRQENRLQSQDAFYTPLVQRHTNPRRPGSEDRTSKDSQKKGRGTPESKKDRAKLLRIVLVLDC